MIAPDFEVSSDLHETSNPYLCEWKICVGVFDDRRHIVAVQREEGRLLRVM